MNSRNRRRPAPGLIVATVALVVALTGTAIGGVTISRLNNQEKREVTKIAKKLDKRVAAAIPPKAAFAHIAGNGDLKYGDGVVSVSRTNDGRYDVVFDRDIGDCGLLASAGVTTADSTSSFYSGIAHVWARGPRTVEAALWDANGGGFADGALFVVALCP